MKLVDIEFKKHDPNKVVSNHMASCGLKIYEHEDSPHDEIFRGVRSYSEVLSRIQALPPGIWLISINFRSTEEVASLKFYREEPQNLWLHSKQKVKFQRARTLASKRLRVRQRKLRSRIRKKRSPTKKKETQR
jgi:hypothetical protein